MLEGKVIIVTGAGSGIGEGTALAMANEGAKLALADIDPEAVEKTYNDVVELGCDATFVVTDVTDPDQVKNMVEHTVSAFGRLDGAFNNAGIEGQLSPLTEIDLEDFDKTIATNLRGVFLCMQYEIQAMENCGGGSIVNTSSIMGLTSAAGTAAYCASKHGVIGLTKAAALDYVQKNIRVNAVCPGGVETPMVTQILESTPEVLEPIMEAVPAKRLASTQELAESVIWLCSDRSSFVTGTALSVDGGYTAR